MNTIAIIIAGLAGLGTIGFALAIFQEHLEQQTRRQKAELDSWRLFR
jgi:hypothetical protein